MTIRTFRTEFPTFDPATLPAIPADWTDVSWKNDTCPKFLAAAGLTWEIVVTIDWADPAFRELDLGSRFFADQYTNEGPSGSEGFYHGDDWDALLAAVEKRAAELRTAEQKKGA